MRQDLRPLIGRDEPGQNYCQNTLQESKASAYWENVFTKSTNFGSSLDDLVRTTGHMSTWPFSTLHSYVELPQDEHFAWQVHTDCQCCTSAYGTRQCWKNLKNNARIAKTVSEALRGMTPLPMLRTAHLRDRLKVHEVYMDDALADFSNV